MELVPIIYNSLLVVSVFLFSVVFISLACSKLNMCGKKKGIDHFDEKTIHEPAVVRENRGFDEIEREHQREARPIIRDNALENKIRIVRRDRFYEDEMPRKHDTNRMSRYLVINPMSERVGSNDRLYHKFSKMSVEYSQTA